MKKQASILFAQQAACADAAAIGGKAAGLAWLFRSRFAVPEWLVLTCDAVDDILRQGGVYDEVQRTLESLSADPDAGRQALASLRKQIRALTLPGPLRAALRGALSTFPEWEARYFAVRASVVDEDGAATSFAGQMESLLFQRGAAALESAILRCIASACSERALAMRRQAGQGAEHMRMEHMRMGVILQEMVEGEVSGILFTAHPLSGSRRHALLTACYGLGEGLVSGRCEADAYTVDLAYETVVSSIHPKPTRVVFDRLAGGGTCEAPVPPALRQQPCLSEAQVLEIVRAGLAIASWHGAPQDVEWTLRGGRLFVLQTRPITLSPAADEHRGSAAVRDRPEHTEPPPDRQGPGGYEQPETPARLRGLLRRLRS